MAPGEMPLALTQWEGLPRERCDSSELFSFSALQLLLSREPGSGWTGANENLKAQ